MQQIRSAVGTFVEARKARAKGLFLSVILRTSELQSGQARAPGPIGVQDCGSTGSHSEKIKV